MANVKKQLEMIQEAIWRYTGYDGNSIDIFLPNWDYNVHLCRYVTFLFDDKSNPVPEEYADKIYIASVLPAQHLIQVREYVPTKPAKEFNI